MIVAIYDTATGRITQTCFGVLSIENAQEICALGQAAIEVDAAVSDATHYIDAGSAVAFSAPPSANDTWDWVTKTWADARTLEQVKAAKWEAVKAQRSMIEYGTFTWDGSTFDCDPVSTSRIMGAFSLAMAALSAAQAYSETWVLADNTTRDLSAADMLAVGAALGAQVSAAFATANTLRAAIDAATTIPDVEAVAWPD